MDAHQPPLVLASARVIAYAILDDQTEYTGRTLIVLGQLDDPSGESARPLGRVPCLAICENLAEPRNVVLLHCDQSWDVLASVSVDTVEGGKAEAERNYPGVGRRWRQLDVTREKALEYYDSSPPAPCSFCGKRAFEIEAMIQVGDARICRGCVEEFHEDFQAEK